MRAHHQGKVSAHRECALGPKREQWWRVCGWHSGGEGHRHAVWYVSARHTTRKYHLLLERKRAPEVSHLELVDEHSNRVQLIALVLALHGICNALEVVKPAKE